MMIPKKKVKKNPGVKIISLLVAAIIGYFNLPTNKALQAEKKLIISEVFVIDGDTIAAKLDGRKIKVRLIGIDAPESSENDRASKQAGWWGCSIREVNNAGARAKRELSALISGNQIELQYDRETTDQYGRTLGYLFAKGHLVNAELLKSGLAQRFTVEPNTSLAAQLKDAEAAAESQQNGLWGRGSPCKFHRTKR